MPTSPDTPPQGPSLEDAAARMLGFLDPPADTETPDSPAEEAPADSDEGVAADAEAQETPDESPEAEAEAPEAEDSEEAHDQKEPQYVTVTENGKSERIPLEEVTKGYLRQQDYTRKTESLSQERKALEQHNEAVRTERQTYATMLVALRDQLQAMQPQEPDWDAVWKADPVGYARQRDEFREKQDKLAAANYELQRLQTLQQQEQAKNLAELVTKNRARMLDMQPAWKDQKRWEADRQRIIDYAQKPEVGYSAEEISQAYDPRAIILLDKARRFDELMAQKPKPVTTNGPRVASAGAAPRGNNALNAAQQRLAKSGSVHDAAKVFEQLLK